jgi:acetyl-CoA acetyltransferase
LDWIATVPPTLALTNRAFGSQKAPVIFGWVLASHQLGAAVAAFLAGYSRSISGSYLEAFVAAGFIAVIAAFAALMIGRGRTMAAEMTA